MKCLPIDRSFEEPYTDFSWRLSDLIHDVTGDMDVTMIFSTVCMTPFEKLGALAAVPEDSTTLIVTPELAVMANNAGLWPIVQSVVFNEILRRSYSPARLYLYSSQEAMSTLGSPKYSEFKRKVGLIVEAVDNSLNVEVYKNVPIPGVPYLIWRDSYLETTKTYLGEILATAAKYGLGPDPYLPYFPDKVPEVQLCLERAVADAIGVSVDELRKISADEVWRTIADVDVFKRIYDNASYEERLVRQIKASELDKDSLVLLLITHCRLPQQQAEAIADGYLRRDEVVMEVYEAKDKLGPCEHRRSIQRIKCPAGGKWKEEGEKKVEGVEGSSPPLPLPPPLPPKEEAGTGSSHSIEFKLYKVKIVIKIPQPRIVTPSPKVEVKLKWVLR